jgi:hypothetical protein
MVRAWEGWGVYEDGGGDFLGWVQSFNLNDLMWER